MLSRTPALGLRALYDRSSLATTRHITSTRMAAASRNVDKMPISNVAAADEPSQDVQEVRRDLVGLLREELRVTEPGVLEATAEEWLAEAGVTVEETDEVVHLSWQAGDYAVEATFERPQGAVDADGNGLGTDDVHELDEEQMAELEKQENQIVHQGVAANNDDGDDDGDDEDDEDDEDDDDDDDDDSSSSSDDENEENSLGVEVNISRLNNDAAKPVKLWCSAGMDNRLYLEQIMFESNPPLNFASLSDAVQDRVYDWLDTIRVDDRLGFYVRRQFYRSKREQAKSTLEAVIDLVQLDTKAVEKKTKKAHNNNNSNKKGAQKK